MFLIISLALVGLCLFAGSVHGFKVNKNRDSRGLAVTLVLVGLIVLVITHLLARMSGFGRPADESEFPEGLTLLEKGMPYTVIYSDTSGKMGSDQRLFLLRDEKGEFRLVFLPSWERPPQTFLVVDEPARTTVVDFPFPLIDTTRGMH